MHALGTYLSIMSTYDAISKEHIAMYDYAGILALVIFLSGVFFLFLVAFCSTIAVAKGIGRLVTSARELIAEHGVRAAK